MAMIDSTLFDETIAPEPGKPLLTKPRATSRMMLRWLKPLVLRAP